jgi:hypothetical protein
MPLFVAALAAYLTAGHRKRPTLVISTVPILGEDVHVGHIPFAVIPSHLLTPQAWRQIDAGATAACNVSPSLAIARENVCQQKILHQTESLEAILNPYPPSLRSA